MVRSFAIASVAVAAAVFQCAEAHTNIVAPAAKWPAGFYNLNSPFARLDSTKIAGAGSDIPANEGVKKIAAQMGTGTLKDFIAKNAKITLDGATMDCGKTLMDGPGQAVPSEIDFPWGHPGPCEAWCDNTKIFFNADCAGNGVGKIKVDQSKCSGAKKLQVMYAGVHVSNYEIYSNCVALGAGGGGAAAGGATAGGAAAGGAAAGGAAAGGAASGGAAAGGNTGGNSQNTGGNASGNASGNTGGNAGGATNNGGNNNGGNNGGSNNNQNNGGNNGGNSNNNGGNKTGGSNGNNNGGNAGNQNNANRNANNNGNNNGNNGARSYDFAEIGQTGRRALRSL